MAKQTVESVARRILRQHAAINDVTVTFSGVGIIARAYPMHHHPIVQERRQRGIEEARAAGALTMASASNIAIKAVEQPVANARGATALEALVALNNSLGGS